MVMPCPNCGRSQDGGRYCQDCGGALPASAATQPPPTDQEGTPAGASSALGKVPAGAWVGLAAVVLILVVTAAMIGSLPRGSASDQPPRAGGAAGPLSLGQPFGSDDGYITLISVTPSVNLFARFEVRGQGEGLDCPDESTTYLLVGTRRYDAAGLARNDQCLHVNDAKRQQRRFSLKDTSGTKHSLTGCRSCMPRPGSRSPAGRLKARLRKPRQRLLRQWTTVSTIPRMPARQMRICLRRLTLRRAG